jgi:hypothetical protein
LKTLPWDRASSKLSNGILFAKFEFLNLEEIGFEVAVNKQIQKGF